MIRSGQTTVATAGTAVQASTDTARRQYYLKAHTDNAGDIYIGNDGEGDVSVSTGLTLGATDPPIRYFGKLSDLWVDAEGNGYKLCWMMVEG